MNRSDIALELRGLKVRYGGIQAIKGISLSVRQGELVTLIGANGAGKTTTLKAITNLIPASEGEIVYRGQSLRSVGAHTKVRNAAVVLP